MFAGMKISKINKSDTELFFVCVLGFKNNNVCEKKKFFLLLSLACNANEFRYLDSLVCVAQMF